MAKLWPLKGKARLLQPGIVSSHPLFPTAASLSLPGIEGISRYRNAAMHAPVEYRGIASKHPLLIYGALIVCLSLLPSCLPLSLSLSSSLCCLSLPLFYSYLCRYHYTNYQYCLSFPLSAYVSVSLCLCMCVSYIVTTTTTTIVTPSLLCVVETHNPYNHLPTIDERERAQVVRELLPYPPRPVPARDTGRIPVPTSTSLCW